MTIDLRATTMCTLGDLISASISDSSVLGAGLIKTSGACEINGLIDPAIGTIVKFYYEKFGVVRELPRQLKVLSSFANPFTNVTTVDLGCQLTYMEGVSEPKSMNPFEDSGNDAFDETDQEIIVLPISAVAVAQKCLAEIGLSGSTQLTNAFSVAEFDLSGGYVNVLNNLLISEGLCGYVDKNGNFATFSLVNPINSASLIELDDLVEAGPLDSNQFPGSPVIVNYSTLKLKDPEPRDADWEELQATRDWELEESFGAEAEVVLNITYPSTWLGPSAGLPPDFPWSARETGEVTFKYTPYTKTITKYDLWDRVVSRRSETLTIAAQANAELTTDLIGYTRVNGFGYYPIRHSTISNITYKKIAPTVMGVLNGRSVKPTPEEGYDEVLVEETISYEPDYMRYGGLPINYLDLLLQGFMFIPTLFEDEFHQTERQTVASETYSRDLVVARGETRTEVGYFPITRTTTKRWTYFLRTTKGQRWYESFSSTPTALADLYATYFPDPRFRPDIPPNSQNAYATIYSLLKGNKLVDAGTEVRQFSGREAVFQGRPPQGVRIVSDLADGGDINNGYRTDSSSEAEFIYGTETAGYDRPVEFSMPYAPDDVFVKNGTGENATFTSFRSDAPQKAAAFGRVQNKLLFGANYGIQIQVSPEKLSSMPYSPIAIQAKSLTGVYRTDGSSWVIDSNGIIASTNAIFVGVAGK